MNIHKYKYLIGLVAAIAATATLNAHSDAFSPEFVDTMVKPYLQMQGSLADDNLEGAKTAASAFVEAMEDVPEGVPSDEVDGFTSPAESIASAADLESARKAFNKLSIEMITLVDHNGTTGKTPLYMAYCPMAFGNKGASWLQGDQTIANPYYGAMMLRCGSIQKQFAGQQADPEEKAHDHMEHEHGMMHSSGKSMTPEELASIHSGVPGYQSPETDKKAMAASASACGMSCCSKKSGS